MWNYLPKYLLHDWLYSFADRLARSPEYWRIWSVRPSGREKC